MAANQVRMRSSLQLQPQPLQPLQPFDVPLQQYNSQPPPSPTRTTEAAAALAQQRFFPQQLLAPPPQQQLQLPQGAHSLLPHFQHSPPMHHVNPPAHLSADPLPPAAAFKGAGRAVPHMQPRPGLDDAVASAMHGGMNTLLGQLHAERVRAGARKAWVEDVDDDDVLDW